MARPQMSPSRRSLLRSIIILLIPCFSHHAVRAAVSWNTDASDQWTTGSNWTGGVIPGSADDVIINRASANPTVTLSGGGTQSIASLINTETLVIDTSTNLSVGSAGAAGAVSGTGTTWLNPGGTLTVNSLSQQQLAVGLFGNVVVRPKAASSTGAVYLGELFMDTGALLDLKDNDLVVDYAGVSPLASVLTLVAQASFGGPGIGSSLAGPGSGHAFTCYESSFLGLNQWPPGSEHLIDSTAIIVAYTYQGDVNSDFKVDSTDLATVDANLNTTPDPSEAWLRGDIDFDGSVTLLDRGIVVDNLGAGVPEPGSLALLAGAMFLMGRRFRRAA